MSVEAGVGNTLKLKRVRVKQEVDVDIAAMEDATPAETVVKLEPGAGPDVVGAAARAAGLAPPKQRPSFTVGAASSAAASSLSTAAAAASPAAAAISSSLGAPAAAARSAPTVMTSSSIGARMARRPRSILDYLVSLDRSSLNALYSDAFTCLTIFRTLHPLAKQYLLRWLFVTAPMRLSLINSWVLATPTSQQAHSHAMRTLWELHLLYKDDGAYTNVKSEGDVKPASDDDPLVWFNPHFQKCLQDALSNKVDATLEDGDAGVATDSERPSIEDLETYASDRWDSILHWMVGATRASTGATNGIATGGAPSREVTSRLISMGLMDPSGAAGSVSNSARITPSGFAFLLKDVATQVWDVVLAYIEGVGGQDSSVGDGTRDQMLHFLFRLSFLKLGMGYPTASLTPMQRILLTDLTAFGLIYVRSPNATRYYPTSLALNLSSTSGNVAAGNASASAAAAAAGGGTSSITASRTLTASSAASSQGYLLVETTFRLYAFTSSPFHAALLSLFARLDVRLPNLLVGVLTKESVRAALKAHISAADIIAYLEAYARADQRANTPVLPENVTDQLRLWEAERNRMAMQEAFLFEFDQGDTPQVVRLVTEEAFRHPHTLLLHHPSKKFIVVSPEGYALLKTFKLRLNAQMAAAAASAPPAGKQI